MRALTLALALVAAPAAAQVPTLALKNLWPWLERIEKATQANTAAIERLGSVAPVPPVPPTPVVPPLGINLTTVQNWSEERSFMNLVAGQVWKSATSAGWNDMAPGRVDRNGNIASVAAGEDAVVGLTMPAAVRTADVRIRCTWQGKGSLNVFPGIRTTNGAQSLEFVWPKADKSLSLVLDTTDPSDPVRFVDCREASAPATQLFDADFVASLAPYKVVRFMDWQNTNFNRVTRWATRTLPGSMSQVREDGVAIENMVALANQANVDPWFNMPWNADDDYVTRFAQYVHANLKPGLKAYVETSNEVWNWGFLVAPQAHQEGVKAGLGEGDNARMRRHAQRTTEVNKIWTRVFADNPSRLVRVLGVQHNYLGLNEIAYQFADTMTYVDAVASAPYFGNDLFAGDAANETNLDRLFVRLNAQTDEMIATFATNKAIITGKYGKRFITYEAGQHVVYRGPDKTLISRLNRDERMYELYKRYIRAWRETVGDTMVLFSSVSPANQNTAWGMAEYSGQPMSETPKRRAVVELANAP